MYEFEYMNSIEELFHKAYEVNKDNIKILAQKFAQNIKEDRIIHAFGTGHSHIVGIEMFGRAGGLGNVNAILDPDTITSSGAIRGSYIEKLPGLADIIYDNYNIQKGDIMVITSNSGRNAVPIEMALRCKKEGVYLVCITNVTQSKSTTSRHSSGLRLFEIADCVIDTCVPVGDGLMKVDKILTGPGSSLVSIFLINTVISEAIKICVDNGIDVKVFQSQNVDEFDNDAIYKKYANRIKMY